MKRWVLLVIAVALFAGCAVGKPVPTQWASSFPMVPYSERVGGAWTGGPDSSR